MMECFLLHAGTLSRLDVLPSIGPPVMIFMMEERIKRKEGKKKGQNIKWRWSFQNKNWAAAEENSGPRGRRGFLESARSAGRRSLIVLTSVAFFFSFSQKLIRSDAPSAFINENNSRPLIPSTWTFLCSVLMSRRWKQEVWWLCTQHFISTTLVEREFCIRKQQRSASVGGSCRIHTLLEVRIYFYCPASFFHFYESCNRFSHTTTLMIPLFFTIYHINYIPGSLNKVNVKLTQKVHCKHPLDLVAKNRQLWQTCQHLWDVRRNGCLLHSHSQYVGEKHL